MGIEQTGNGSALVESKGCLLVLVILFALLLTFFATGGNVWREDAINPSPEPTATAQP